MFLRKVSLILVALTLSICSFGNISFAEKAPESEASQVVKDFLTSMVSGDFTKATSLVVDQRFSNSEEQIKEYKAFSNSTDLSSLEITSVDTENSNSLYVNLKDNSGKSETGKVIHVKNIDGAWKIMLGNTSDGQRNISTNAFVDSFQYNGLQYGATYTSTFSIPSGVSKIMLQGWQYSSNSYPANVSYQLAQDDWLGYKTLGEPVDVDYDGNYSINLFGASSGSNFCIRIFVGNSANVNLSANISHP
ncbi:MULTISPECIES: DUF4878 domain-containing protein [Bacillales]|uniref:DUF4878 domain-containing protein n=1 Tax=Paenibacillus polymyxa TaxID=1406 RepID=A0A8I1LQE0_PAEPO|nr:MULTISPECIES: DUF4878 domain-containing protein [Paenibacillus]KAF6575960.1 DUF4878 domain-containing protein [Paenibacillus sp. EKM206P]KAF6589593.1 DUF4878 domain-containing protein [Paenibacillus sp. EKM205P]MBM0633386.1 DUF4878 domain-containing protein [Paenibacillus polymyxa]